MTTYNSSLFVPFEITLTMVALSDLFLDNVKYNISFISFDFIPGPIQILRNT